MKTKLLVWFCIAFGLFGICSSSVLAKWNLPNLPRTYANIFSWYAEVPSGPDTNDVVKSKIFLVGKGGIKVSALTTAFSKYEVSIDGSGISSGAGNASKVEQDFDAVPGNVYFVTKSATCALPTAVGLLGKEILVWNECVPAGAVNYTTVESQTVSGLSPRSVANSTAYQLDRFMSDGSNWLKE